ncbi:hypothetical protein NicSoilB8_30750 [Arthrobacter sp. NicSoilB8]|nr:hypothetical protein NicSoilB8_30750 [Arthrobacter sp. NicSoilB8]
MQGRGMSNARQTHGQRHVRRTADAKQRHVYGTRRGAGSKASGPVTFQRFLMCATGSVWASTMCFAFFSARFSLIVLTDFFDTLWCGVLSGMVLSLTAGARNSPAF